MNIDYKSVTIPDEKPREEYDHRERRAAILQRVLDEGQLPWEMNKTALADEYGVSRNTIHTDVDRLRDYLDEHIGEDVEIKAMVVYKDAVDQLREDAAQLREDGDIEAAARVEKKAVDAMSKWFSWLFDSGEKEKAADKHEIDAHVTAQSVEPKVYIGLDPTTMPGVDPERMTGVAFGPDYDRDVGDGEDDSSSASSIEIEDVGE